MNGKRLNQLFPIVPLTNRAEILTRCLPTLDLDVIQFSDQSAIYSTCGINFAEKIDF